jgi:hypothetical protein
MVAIYVAIKVATLIESHKIKSGTIIEKQIQTQGSGVFPIRIRLLQALLGNHPANGSQLSREMTKGIDQS